MCPFATLWNALCKGKQWSVTAKSDDLYIVGPLLVLEIRRLPVFSFTKCVSWLWFNTAFLIYGLPFWIIIIRVHSCIKTFQSNIYLMTINYFKATLWGRRIRKRGVHWLLRYTLLCIALPVIRPKNTYSSPNSLITCLFLYNNQTSTKWQKIDITPTIKEF